MRLAQHIHLNKRANLKQEEQQNKQTNTQEKRHMSACLEASNLIKVDDSAKNFDAQ